MTRTTTIETGVETRAGAIVTLLTELHSDTRGTVYEIGSLARVLEADGDRLTLLVDHTRGEDVLTCSRSHVAQHRRAIASRRRVLSQTFRVAA